MKYESIGMYHWLLEQHNKYMNRNMPDRAQFYADKAAELSAELFDNVVYVKNFNEKGRS